MFWKWARETPRCCQYSSQQRPMCLVSSTHAHARPLLSCLNKRVYLLCVLQFNWSQCLPCVGCANARLTTDSQMQPESMIRYSLLSDRSYWPIDYSTGRYCVTSRASLEEMDNCPATYDFSARKVSVSDSETFRNWEYWCSTRLSALLCYWPAELWS